MILTLASDGASARSHSVREAHVLNGQPGHDSTAKEQALSTTAQPGLAGPQGLSSVGLWQGTSSLPRAELPTSGGTRDHADGMFLGAGQHPQECGTDRSNIFYIAIGGDLDSSSPLF